MTRFGLRIGCVIAAIALAGCAGMRINAFVERGADLTRYRTFSWASSDGFRTGDPRLDNNSLFEQQLQRAIERGLTARRMEHVTAGTSDLFVHYHASVTQKIEARDVDRQYRLCEGCEPYVYDAGTLLIDLVDARSNALVWRGWAERSLEGMIDNQQWMEQTVNETVARILQKLPPRL